MFFTCQRSLIWLKCTDLTNVIAFLNGRQTHILDEGVAFGLDLEMGVAEARLRFHFNYSKNSENSWSLSSVCPLTIVCMASTIPHFLYFFDVLNLFLPQLRWIIISLFFMSIDGVLDIRLIVAFAFVYAMWLYTDDFLSISCSCSLPCSALQVNPTYLWPSGSSTR